MRRCYKELSANKAPLHRKSCWLLVVDINITQIEKRSKEDEKKKRREQFKKRWRYSHV